MFDINNYKNRGYEVEKGMLTQHIIDGFEEGFAKVAAMQAYKIFGHDEFKRIRDFGTAQDFENVVEFLFTKDNAAFNEMLKIYDKSYFSHNFITKSGIIEKSAELLGIDPGHVQSYGPHLMVNKPSSETRLYTWHSEASWFPKRRRFINIWIPVVRAKNKKNGTMFFKEKSHLRADWPFSEFQGYKNDSFGNQKFYIQYEIPNEELEHLKEVHVEAERGDVVFFERNLVHRSSANLSNENSFVFVMRCFDYRTDATVCGNPSERPYKSNVNGRSNLNLKV